VLSPVSGPVRTRGFSASSAVTSHAHRSYAVRLTRPLVPPRGLRSRKLAGVAHSAPVRLRCAMTRTCLGRCGPTSRRRLPLRVRADPPFRRRSTAAGYRARQNHDVTKAKYVVAAPTSPLSRRAPPRFHWRKRALLEFHCGTAIVRSRRADRSLRARRMVIGGFLNALLRGRYGRQRLIRPSIVARRSYCGHMPALGINWYDDLDHAASLSTTDVYLSSAPTDGSSLYLQF
jgi:hypothetical protein